MSDDDFFGPLPEPPPEPPRRAQREWFGPPSGTLPGVVPLELVLARSELAAVCVTRISAYPTGFAFELLTVSDADAGEDLDPHLMGIRHHRGRAGGTDTQLRLGVQFSNDAKATNVGAAPGFAGRDEKPQAPCASPSGRRRRSWQLAPRLLGLATAARRAAGVRMRVAGSFDPADAPRDRRAVRARCVSARSGDLPAWNAVTSRRDDHDVRGRIKPRSEQLIAHTPHRE